MAFATSRTPYDVCRSDALWAGSEAIAVANAEAVHALVGRDGVGVRHVLEIGRQARVLVEAVAYLGGDMEKHAGAERLAVPVFQLQLAVVHGAAETQSEEDAARRLVLPARVNVGVAGGADGGDRAADRGTDAAAQKR